MIETEVGAFMVNFHDWRWVKNGSIEILWVWSDEFSVGKCGVVTRVEEVRSTSSMSVSTGWKVSLTRVSEVWSLGSEVWVGTITRWVSHDVGVVGTEVEVLVDGGLVSLESEEVLEPVGPVSDDGVHGGVEASFFGIRGSVEGGKTVTNGGGGSGVNVVTEFVEGSGLCGISGSLVSNGGSLGGGEFSDEVLLLVGLHHGGGPSESITDPGVDLSDVDIVDLGAGLDSGGGESGHSGASGGVVVVHGTFLGGDEGSEVSSHSDTGVVDVGDGSGGGGSGISLVLGDSGVEFSSGISDDLVEFSDGGFEHSSEFVGVVVVGVLLVGDLSVSVWVWKSEVIEFSNTGEVVSDGVEAGGTLSESGLLNIVSTAVSEDVHGVDDIFLDGGNVVVHFLLESGSGILEESELGIHVGIEGDNLVLSESVESDGAGFSEVGDSSVGSEFLSGDLFHHVGVGGGVLVSHVSEHGVLSSELGLGPVVELAHESVVLFD